MPSSSRSTSVSSDAGGDASAPGPDAAGRAGTSLATTGTVAPAATFISRLIGSRPSAHSVTWCGPGETLSGSSGVRPTTRLSTRTSAPSGSTLNSRAVRSSTPCRRVTASRASLRARDTRLSSASTSAWNRL